MVNRVNCLTTARLVGQRGQHKRREGCLASPTASTTPFKEALRHLAAPFYCAHLGTGEQRDGPTGGSMAAEYRRANSGIDAIDYLIAATETVTGADFLTTNVGHFPMIPGLQPPYTT